MKRHGQGTDLSSGQRFVDTDDFFVGTKLDWWDRNGPMKKLHALNEIRLPYIEVETSRWMGTSSENSLKSLTVLDVGCGGGLLSDRLGEAGAIVTGIDASPDNIRAAKLRDDQRGFGINYLLQGVDQMENGAFDVVVCMEVVEHVDNLDQFLASCVSKVSQNGLVFLATINRTFWSLLAHKFAAEYILRWLPRGTHSWKKFVTPSELKNILRRNGFETCGVQGVSANPLSGSLFLSNQLSGNYMMVARKVRDRFEFEAQQPSDVERLK
ncbi:MAG: bifunctional 3-demethylubiquinol 3-O-methyltransferase/2-polyprenyl-6-hydroxyphenol methylase [Gammaproteobacteria bacterium]|nr:bifunctional 3-demethylubiquinol 3-O-methyltransferase/2-polyprenyl-6-hydroxyphenol methylase [Gammaproteobacteria bacterium]|tara:strand:- start:75 stop:878 length:804 start_codon:yes stop_codon:yes gene_type:complete